MELGHHPDDPTDEKLRKSSLLVVSGPFALAGIVWGALYLTKGLTIPGWIPFSYGILSIINIVSFGFSKKYIFFRNSQLFLILILPFALQLSLGGFVQSSAVIYWAIIAPAGAMFFDSIKRSVYWFAAYLSLVVVAFFINDKLPEYVNWNLSESFVNVLFLMNIFGVSIIVYGILYYFVGTITTLNRDIEKKNEALKTQSEKLKEMDEIKSKFFANISHEFRTPLTLILGLVNKQIAKPQIPPVARDSETIKRNAHKLLHLINQLLDLSKLESGVVKLEVSRSDIKLFAKNVTAQFESMAAAKQIEIKFNGQKIEEHTLSEPHNIFFDQKKMQKVFTNLLSNAVKFSSVGGNIEVEVESVKCEEDPGDMVSIRVINSGPEIPEEKLPRLFDRFYQVESDSNRQYEGTGIGLALVKELVELHNGTVTVASKMRKTTFSILLPGGSAFPNPDETIDDKVEHEELANLALDGLSEESTGGDLREDVLSIESEGKLVILVVEDNPDLRAFIRGTLDRDYEVVEAVDGIDGFEKAEQSIPDLIVSDVMMPRMDGYDLCKKLKSNEKTNHIPVVLLTAKATKENKLEGLGHGADDYLIKPFDEEELRIRIKNLIAIRKKLQRKFQSEMRWKPKEMKVSSIHQRFIGDLNKVVEENLGNESFGVEDLAKAMGMSRSQIHRKLKALTDQSATTFIRHYRLHRASELLRQDAGNISEIAFQVGFNSQTYFSSSFQEVFNCSPSAYRDRSGNAKY